MQSKTKDGLVAVKFGNTRLSRELDQFPRVSPRVAAPYKVDKVSNEAIIEVLHGS